MRSLYFAAMVLLFLAACTDKGSGGSESADCATGTLVDGECVPATDDSAPPGDDTGTSDTHTRWVTAGASHTCLLVDGAVTCWGKSDGGELDVPDKGPFASVDATEHTCALLAGEDGGGVCWGPEEYSENYVLAGDYLAVTAGDDHGCGFTTFGTVCWGSNIEGQANAPGVVMKAIDAGAFHTCGIHGDATGHVQCWGRTDAHPAGALVFDSVSAGGDSACGITGGELRCWGEDKAVIGGFPKGKFAQVSVGVGHACAIDGAGAVRCWGDDGEGQTDVPAGTYTQVSAGTDHTCALTEAGDVVCWGSDADGKSSPP